MPDQTTRRLVVAFNFPPFTDGSAVTVAKRIIEADVPVDVFSADLSSVRARDESLWDLVSPWIRDHQTVKVPILFADERSLVPFVTAGETAIRKRGTSYDEVYSRSMWPHSHFLAARLRTAGHADRWIAEFSDPILWHVDGTPRPSGTTSLKGSNLRLLRAVDHRSQTFLRNNATVLAWAQFIPFLLADQLVFTNEQQLTVMLSDAPEWMRAGVEKKAVIAPHPTLGSEHYRDESEPTATPSSSRYSIGYFGTFYPNRGGGEFLEAISLLPAEMRERLELHVFTADAGTLLDVAARLNISDCVHRRPPLPFRDFLRVSGRYDALLVNDIATSPFGVPSPFLPSKYSDYAGSSAATMAITLPSSPLDNKPARWRAHVGDVDGIARMLASAITVG
ncbi:hypothetical protein V1260_07955 [Brachybacterium sp. J144]|uniref:hypothetical protein n=1 Tax=Brachybacterium sp. J144 TaxID=3116487 RepID=UPI002E79B58E|nr:hypothetical protein [Brachybacterium sp. J144]MEE1650725.1 hypothetical protein [Brachybacterium sp. J144]